MGPYQRTPNKEVARAIRYSGFGVHSLGPVGDVLELYHAYHAISSYIVSNITKTKRNALGNHLQQINKHAKICQLGIINHFNPQLLALIAKDHMISFRASNLQWGSRIALRWIGTIWWHHHSPSIAWNSTKMWQ